MGYITNYLKTEKAQQTINTLAEQYPRKKLLKIDFQDVERFNQELADRIREDPEDLAKEFEDEATPLLITDSEKVEIKVGFINIPHEYSPPTLGKINARYIGKLMRFEGVIAQTGIKYPKPRIGFFKCNRCDGEERVPQSVFWPGRGLKQPGFCRQCGKQSEFRFIDSGTEWTLGQTLLLSENPDQLRAGQNVDSIYVYLNEDLCMDSFDLMNKVIIDGILKTAPTNKQSDQKFMFVLIATNLEVTNKSLDELEISKEDEDKIIEFSQTHPHILEEFANSLAPTIYGHDEMKKALILQLLGGTEKELPDARRRSEINILALSDPSTAKSLLAKSLVALAPRAIYTTGSGARVGGLTSTAEKDPLTGEWMIKPGALPMASGGLLVVDEFTEMGPDEVNSLREGMESGVVTATKAGKSIQFMARTSVFACANPKAGRFDNYTQPLQQVEIPPPILSRFDLIFVYRDVVDIELDKKIADTIFNVHTNQIATTLLVDKNFIRKYIAYAKRNYKPILDPKDPQVRQEMIDFYTRLRAMSTDGSVTITTRQYEAIFRLAEASAKLKLKKIAGLEDVHLARTIVLMSMQQVATDIKTGQIDVDMMYTSKPKSERDKVKTIERVLHELAARDKIVEIQALYDELKMSHEIEPFYAERVLEDMKKQGIVYSPKVGQVMFVGG